MGYIVPGLASHRVPETSRALAELVYKNGFSAISVNSPFNSEFIEHATTAALLAAERSNDLENTFLKVAVLRQSTLTPQTSLPFSAIESKFLIGLAFRLDLRDMIYSSQRQNNQDVLQHSINNWRRDAVYQEIFQYSFQDYFQKFAIPYYQHHGLACIRKKRC